MAVSNLINNNEEYVREAITNGIDGNAVNSTLEDMISATELRGKNPEQVKEVVETIVDMKTDTQNEIDESYASDFVKENNKKINSALENGIKPEEIAKTLIENTEKANNKKSRKHLKFITKLISKMKKKELILNREHTNEKGYQKIKQ